MRVISKVVAPLVRMSSIWIKTANNILINRDIQIVKERSVLRGAFLLHQVSSGGVPATNRHNPYSINPGLLDPRYRGLNGCCMSGEFLLLVVNPAPQPLPKIPAIHTGKFLHARSVLSLLLLLPIKEKKSWITTT